VQGGDDDFLQDALYTIGELYLTSRKMQNIIRRQQEQITNLESELAAHRDKTKEEE
jgi:hypothetical protein